jgi:hypothetical protein
MMSWVEFVKLYASHNKCSYKIALKKCSKLYKKYKEKEEKKIEDQKGGDLAPRNVPPPKERKFLEENKDAMIVSLRICRKPIFSILQRMINLIQKFSRHRKNAMYDKLFHLYALVVLDNGTAFMMERNEVFHIKEGYKDDDGECVDVKSPSHKFGEIINKCVANNGDENFWHYDAIQNNCQDFIISFLNACGVNDPDIQKFVKQDVSQLLPNFVKKVVRKVTDVAHGVDKVINGEGQEVTKS